MAERDESHMKVGNHMKAGSHRRAEEDKNVENHSWAGKIRCMMGQKSHRMMAAKGSFRCPHKLGDRRGGSQRMQGRVRGGLNRGRRIRTQRKRGGCRSSDLMAGKQGVGRPRRSRRLPHRGYEPRGGKRKRSSRTCGRWRKRAYRH